MGKYKDVCVFLSHSQCDLEVIESVEKTLKNLGVSPDNVFRDRSSMSPSDLIWPRIRNAIKKSDLYVILWTSNAVLSEGVEKERRMLQHYCEEIEYERKEHQNQYFIKPLKTYRIFSMIDEELKSKDFKNAEKYMKDIYEEDKDTTVYYEFKRSKKGKLSKKNARGEKVKEKLKECLDRVKESKKTYLKNRHQFWKKKNLAKFYFYQKYHRYGRDYKSYNYLGMALTYCEQISEYSKRQLGSTHPDTLDIWIMLGRIYFETKKYALAEERIKEAENNGKDVLHKDQLRDLAELLKLVNLGLRAEKQSKNRGLHFIMELFRLLKDVNI